MSAGFRYLLIVSCSQRKRPCSGICPAIDLYDGSSFRVLRKAQREGYWPSELNLLILSAKYGLIEATTLVENYDQKMTRERALALQAPVSTSCDWHLSRDSYSQVFINLGRTYMIALAQSKAIPLLGGRVHYANGGIGQKASEMKAWLQRLYQESD